MRIEQSPHRELTQSLLLGGFPINVEDFQESPILFERVAYVDYRLQVLVQREFGGRTLSRASPSNCNDAVFAEIAQLIAFLRSIGSNNGSDNRTYDEDLYYTVVLAHLHHLNSESEKVPETLGGFRLDNLESEFAAYSKARYFMLLGSSAHKPLDCWSRFLVEMRKYGSKSLVAANIWISKVFRATLLHLSGNGANPVRFADLLAQRFSDNAVAFVAFCNYAMKPENERFILKECRLGYVVYLADLIQRKQKQHIEFPDATEQNTVEVDFVESLFNTLNGISEHREVVGHFLAPKSVRLFLVDMLSKSFRSTVVLLNYIRTLLDLKEFDEALAAFKTYGSYIKTELAQNGTVPNILEVIEVYAMCIENFNPAGTLTNPETDNSFKYNSTESVLEALETAKHDLLRYLDTVADMASLRYDKSIPEYAANDLAFLYYRYNPSLVLGDKSELTKVVSYAWHSLGQSASYLATHGSPTDYKMRQNVADSLSYFKNALTVNCTGSVKYLTSYALALAYSDSVKLATKLCKFILKRFPESFRTWNLLVLLVSGSGQEAALYDETPASSSQTFLDDGNDSTGNKKKEVGPERFADDALNIAGIYIAKNKEMGVALDLETKYQILQLKITLVAVIEAKHGTEAALEVVVEVFALFRELFDGIELNEQITRASSKRDARWSHRPSVMDPKGTIDSTREKYSTREQNHKISRSSIDSRRSTKGKPGQILRSKNHKAAATESEERLILQRLCLWAASIYLKLELFDEAEQCIVEAETVAAPNVETYAYLGLLTSKSRKFLSLQEFERSLELFNTPKNAFNKRGYCATLLGMCKLFIVDDDKENSLFVSNKDLRAGLIRLKNYLESFSTCYPYGHNCSEVWYYLSSIYETFDDKPLYADALWRCVELEKNRPVRSYDICEELR